MVTRGEALLYFAILAACACLALVAVAPGDPVDETLTLIMAEEGFRSRPYEDTRGNLTIGYGFKISSGISKHQAELLARSTLEKYWTGLTRSLPWIKDQPRHGQGALLDMSYQEGVDGVLKFTDTLAALKAGDCAKAKAAALDSLWARETPDRARRVTDRLCAD